MKITYGLAEFDNYTGRLDWNINLPMDGVQCGTMYEFRQSAGELAKRAGVSRAMISKIERESLIRKTVHPRRDLAPFFACPVL
jgi:DNA-binding XRE family transcriptional regulator